MELFDKLTILSDAAKYDVSCTSSGSERKNIPHGIGSAAKSGICHTWTGDGRCVSLLKILLSNCCVYDCQYCVNRVSNDVPRTSFTPKEIADLTIGFYKRNYIEGLFLSSAVIKNPDYTAELLLQTLTLLRNTYRFNGYIHVKAIPGASPILIDKLGHLADRISVNIELPSAASLTAFAPQKSKQAILAPMRQIHSSIQENQHALTVYRHADQFAPAGQSTQMIIGATPESDYKILTLSEALYQKYHLKRVFYSAYIPVGSNPLLPVREPPLLREHRLYQADWLLRYYGFTADELLNEQSPNFNPIIDPKSNWALAHPEQFPIDINTAPYHMILRIPGIGIRSAQKIMAARKTKTLDFHDLKKMRISMKRAQYFIICKGKYINNMPVRQEYLSPLLLAENPVVQYGQINIFDMLPKEESIQCLRIV